MTTTKKSAPAGDRKHEKYDRLIAIAKTLPAVTAAVAHPCDEASLRGALEAAEAGIIKPILVGSQDKIREVAAKAGLSIADIEIVDAPYSQAAAAMAVELVRTGRAEVLMKGSLHSDELLARSRNATQACARPAHQPCLHHGCSRTIRTLCSSPMQP